MNHQISGEVLTEFQLLFFVCSFEKMVSMSVATLRSNIIASIAEVNDEDLLEEIDSILKNHSIMGDRGNELGKILGPVDYEELERQLHEPEEEYTWEEVKRNLKSFPK